MSTPATTTGRGEPGRDTGSRHRDGDVDGTATNTALMAGLRLSYSPEPAQGTLGSPWSPPSMLVGSPYSPLVPYAYALASTPQGRLSLTTTTMTTPKETRVRDGSSPSSSSSSRRTSRRSPPHGNAFVVSPTPLVSLTSSPYAVAEREGDEEMERGREVNVSGMSAISEDAVGFTPARLKPRRRSGEGRE